MFRCSLLAVIFLSLSRNVRETTQEASECLLEDGWTSGLSVQRHKDEDGGWRLSFATCVGRGDPSEATKLDLKQRVIREVGGKELVQIAGVLTDVPDSSVRRKLKFSPKGGRSAVISDDGMTAFRENAEKNRDYAPVFTNRPLKNNELFEVEVKKKISAFPGWPVGIGVTTHIPETMKMPGWMGALKSGNWMLYDTTLHFNGSEVKNNYGRGYAKLQPGDKIGVMRTQSGSLHFFLNGVDEGVAASDIPYPVYGVVDLIRNIAQVTIVNRCPAEPGQR